MSIYNRENTFGIHMKLFTICLNIWTPRDHPFWLPSFFCYTWSVKIRWNVLERFTGIFFWPW